ncbi:MAG: acyl--CoA ligase [Bacilli bacterium]|nr:acyl--CoA ligase [Bacilli bacterium]
MANEIGNYIFEDIYNLQGEEAGLKALYFQNEFYTFKELGSFVDYLAGKFLELGIKKGDHVALLGMNSINWIASFFALTKIGAISTLLNFISRHNELVRSITFTDCKFIVYGKYVAEAKDPDDLSKLLKDCKIGESHSFSIKPKDLNPREILLAGPYPHIESAYPREEESKRTSYIVFTTGTTAEPKGVMLSEYGLLNNIYHNLYKLDGPKTKSCMCLLPLFHCFGLLIATGFLAYRKTVYLNEMSDPVDVFNDFRRHKVGFYASVGIIFDKLARTPFFWILGKKRFTHCIVGGGFTSEKEFKFLERKYGKGKFLNGYGQSEASPLISLVMPDSPASKQRESVGIPMDDLEIKTFDAASKLVQDPTVPGEILVKGYNVCNGYYKLPVTKQPIDEQGYLHTGDLGYIDKDGYLVLTGRCKDIIIRKGENISAKEVEKAFEPYKEFTSVRVMGFPSLTDGETVIAVVELPKKPLHFHESHYIQELHKVLPSLKIPSHIVYFPSFPLAANGKLDERTLREWVEDKLNRIVDPKLYKEIRRIQKNLRK